MGISKLCHYVCHWCFLHHEWNCPLDIYWFGGDWIWLFISFVSLQKDKGQNDRRLNSPYFFTGVNINVVYIDIDNALVDFKSGIDAVSVKERQIFKD